jgi:GxxExxY protein
MNVECGESLAVCDEALISDAINCAFTVHKELGAGLLESVYERALLFELRALGLNAITQVEVPVMYRGADLGIGFRADIIVNSDFLIELKSVEKITNLHLSQVITYLKLLRFKRGIIFNFNAPLLKNGIKRVSI